FFQAQPQLLIRCALRLAAAAAPVSLAMLMHQSALPRIAPVAMATMHRRFGISAALLKAKKKTQQQKHAASAPAAAATEIVSNPELLERLELDKLTARGQAELASFKELLFRNLRLQITADVLHDIEVSTGSGRVPLGSLADVYQKSSDTLVLDLTANRSAVPAVRQALALKGFNGREQAADADCLTVSLPRVTGEHRRRLAANGRELLHRAKLATKRLHDSATKRLKEAERAGHYSKDDLRACQQLLVAEIKRANAQLDSAWAAKEKELLGTGTSD
uniref:Ribosome-recycling factor, mitochondrial n=2 Tax=Macrostomum lignano TaxID=282301 RepID=A0A1I8GYF1_9PLAT